MGGTQTRADPGASESLAVEGAEQDVLAVRGPLHKRQLRLHLGLEKISGKDKWAGFSRNSYRFWCSVCCVALLVLLLCFIESAPSLKPAH